MSNGGYQQYGGNPYGPTGESGYGASNPYSQGNEEGGYGALNQYGAPVSM
jgi:syntaxin 1B/2/3